MRWAWATIALLVLPGCGEPLPPPPAPALAETVLDVATGEAPPGAYAFFHPGGQVALRIAQPANVTLFGPDDRVVATFAGLRGPAPDMAAPAGELVLLAESPAADPLGLAVTSAGADVPRLRRLPTVRGFEILAEDAQPLPMPLAGRHVQKGNVTLEGPLLAAQVWVAGPHEDLDVALEGKGPAVAAWSPGSPFGSGLPFFGGEAPLETAFERGNATSPSFGLRVAYASLDGAVLLEYETYSRAGGTPRARPDVVGSGAAAGRAAFTYGTLPATPVAFDAAGPRVLLRAKEGAGLVGLWDAQDALIGLYDVPKGRAVAVPVPGGRLVAFAYNGTVELGADRAPADFDLQPLDVKATDVPRTPAGSGGRLGQRTDEIQAHGVAFRFSAVDISPSPLFPFCLDPVRLELLEDGRALGDGGDGGWEQATRFHQGGALAVKHTGYGETGCSYRGLRIESFAR